MTIQFGEHQCTYFLLMYIMFSDQMSLVDTVENVVPEIFIQNFHYELINKNGKLKCRYHWF